MIDNETSRLSRLTATLVLLQTKRLVTSSELARKFSVSSRTIYRDIRALEQAGVPILTEEGKGYSLMEGYRIPPIMFTDEEANALITAEQYVRNNRDLSFVREFSGAVDKVRNVLRSLTKDRASLLADRIAFHYKKDGRVETNYLSTLQSALTDFRLAEIQYESESGGVSKRRVEPFALCNTEEKWLLIAWCRLRREYRTFRLDRIKHLQVLEQKFPSHNMTLQEYFMDSPKKNRHR
ncbi:YafY family protein [Pedobacter sp. SYP-B3415]|uniref:helix-turn-helix transcriptional regulator n=1 Tax=Pedobacter sp. SYP-B3415 TaxID=2496641 RepID=UPI00101CE6F4|nr:YafY family protein [Pedobacter sp. SYP-B3415]